MFWKKKRPASLLQPHVRGALFGNQSLNTCAIVAQEQALYEAPWSIYVRAHELILSNQDSEALRLLERLTLCPHLNAHHYAQIYHHLRTMESEVNLPLRLLGVVVETGRGGQDYDLLGAYVARKAQFYPVQGGYAHWERPNASLDESIGIVLTMGEVLLPQTPNWSNRALPPIGGTQLRVTLVTSQGLYVLEDEHQQLTSSMLVDRLYAASEDLMQRLRSILHEAP